MSDCGQVGAFVNRMVVSDAGVSKTDLCDNVIDSGTSQNLPFASQPC